MGRGKWLWTAKSCFEASILRYHLTVNNLRAYGTKLINIVAVFICKEKLITLRLGVGCLKQNDYLLEDVFTQYSILFKIIINSVTVMNLYS